MVIVHTIVSVFCPKDGTTEMGVLGTFLDEQKARKCFEDQKEKERKLAKEYGWKVYSDDYCYYEAGEDGNFNNHFGMLYWHKEIIENTSE